MSRSAGEEVAACHLGAVLMRLLRNSKVPVPRVRKAALIESCRAAHDQESIQAIVLDSFTGSPYIPDDFKNRIVESVLTGQWQELDGLEKELARETTSFAARTFLPRSQNMSPQNILLDFQSMVLYILKTSRKIQRGLVLEKKKALFATVRRSASKEHLIETMLEALSNAKTIDEASRQLIANDVFDAYFHRLLLPDRFDCYEKPRVSVTTGSTEPEQNEDGRRDEECPICLDLYSSQREMPRFQCRHIFCQDCTDGWINSGYQMDCPICRSSLQHPSVNET